MAYTTKEARGIAQIEPYLGLADIREITGHSARTVATWRSAGKLPRPDFQQGRRPLWKLSTIQLWLNSTPEKRGEL